MSEERKTAWKAGEEMLFSICIEVQGLGVDEDGNTCAGGARMDMNGTAKKDTTYDEIIAGIEPLELIQMFFLEGIASAGAVRIISPEEYEEKYGNAKEVEVDE